MVAGTSMHSNFMEVRARNALGVKSGTWTVGAEATNVRTLSLQLLDGNGAPYAGKKVVKIIVYATTAKAALATGGSTGIAVAAGTILVLTDTAKLIFEVLSTALGVVDLTWTDTGTESVVVSAEVDGVTIDTAAFANT